MKLGKLHPKFNDKTLLLTEYLKASALPPPPSKSYYEYKVPSSAWGMLGNDRFGDCTCAGPAHEVINRTAHSGAMVSPTLDQVLAMYAAICPGFDPATDANDNGAAITDALNYMLETGLAGHKIDGWAAIDNASIQSVKQGIYLFGSVNIGVQLPSQAQNQFSIGQTWTPVPGDTIEGGHCIALMGYGSEGATCVTWGALQQLTWEWFEAYCDEAYCEISLDWLNAGGLAPNALDMATLQADLAQLKA